MDIKQEGEKKKHLGKEIKHATGNKYFMAQAGKNPRPCEGEVASHCSVASCTGWRGCPQGSPSVWNVPALCNGDVLKSPYASRTIILQHLCFELDTCWSGEGSLTIYLVVAVCHLHGDGDQTCHAACPQRDRGRVVATRPLQPTTTFSHGSWFAKTVLKVCFRQHFPGKKTKCILTFYYYFHGKIQKKENLRGKDKDTLHSWKKIPNISYHVPT